MHQFKECSTITRRKRSTKNLGRNFYTAWVVGVSVRGTKGQDRGQVSRNTRIQIDKKRNYVKRQNAMKL